MSESEEYEVIICGTDLIQSILSSALSRAGKKVLHCDGNEWYGGFDAVLYVGGTLDCFIEGCRDADAVNGEVTEENCGVERECGFGEFNGGIVELKLLPRERYADLKLHSQTFIPLEELEGAPPQTQDEPSNSATERNDSSLIKSQTEKEASAALAQEANKCPHENSTTNTSISEEIKTQQPDASTQEPDPSLLPHGFSLDISPSLIYAAGDAVQGLVKSGVADYLEFKSLKGLYLLMAEDGKKQRGRGSNARDAEKASGGDASKELDAKNETLISYRVPCSKGDVFRSHLLSPVDKRRLMKFLQLISDYGMTLEDSTSVEAEIPNKDTIDDQTTDSQNQSDLTSPNTSLPPESTISEPSAEDAMYSINERYLHKGRSLSRPQNKAKPSSSELDTLMRCIHDNVPFRDFLSISKLPPRLCSVVTHALALSPFGNQCVNQYSTKNGVDDLLRHVSSLGRFGDTAFLVPMYGSGELSQAFCRSGAVYGSTYMLRRCPLSISTSDGGAVRAVTLSGEEHIGGLGDVDTDDTSNKKVGCSHVIVPSTMLPKGVVGSERLRVYRRISILKGSLITPQDNKDVSDKEQRYAVVIPPQTSGLKNSCAVHGVVVDDSAFVAPAGKGYTILHLTTSVMESDGADDQCLDILAKSVQFLIESQSSQENGATDVKECHHIAFSYSTHITPPTTEQKPIVSGLHICHRDTQSLTCDYAFREAKRIFDEICPDADFLGLAQKVEDSIVYRNKEESDDERVVLSNALDMIQGGVENTELVEVVDVSESEVVNAAPDEVNEPTDAKIIKE